GTAMRLVKIDAIDLRHDMLKAVRIVGDPALVEGTREMAVGITDVELCRLRGLEYLVAYRAQLADDLLNVVGDRLSDVRLSQIGRISVLARRHAVMDHRVDLSRHLGRMRVAVVLEETGVAPHPAVLQGPGPLLQELRRVPTGARVGRQQVPDMLQITLRRRWHAVDDDLHQAAIG